jgi:ACS family glucarate transporter-like MFS transporter
LVLALIFLITTINYADRSAMSIAGSPMSKELHIDSVQLGYLFSAFGWSYAIGQIPGGWLLDRFGSKRVYAVSIGLWSIVTMLAAFAGVLTTTVVASVAFLFVLRFLLGLVESPAFPANNRVAIAWFPTSERGRATSIFNSAQYFAGFLFTPLTAWLVQSFGWRSAFVVLGAGGLVLGVVWLLWMKSPANHPRVNEAELAKITDGGGLPYIDGAPDEDEAAVQKARHRVSWSEVRQLFTSRLLWGTYVGQYCITALTFFFTTWFPIYLIQGRHMDIMGAGFAAAVPALFGFTGGLAGGFLSDFLMKRGVSVTWARKTPFVVGMLLAGAIGLANFMDSDVLIITTMALAFFGKGLAAVGWAVVSDAAPKEATGLASGVFNGLGNVAGIVTPIVIGYILAATGSFQGALWFVSAHCIVALVAYLSMGRIRRLEFAPRPGERVEAA